jgi:hypothetical protein
MIIPESVDKLEIEFERLMEYYKKWRVKKAQMRL